MSIETLETSHCPIKQLCLTSHCKYLHLLQKGLTTVCKIKQDLTYFAK